MTDQLIARVQRYVDQLLPLHPDDGRDLLAAYRALQVDVERLREIERLAQVANDHDAYLPPEIDRARMALRLALLRR